MQNINLAIINFKTLDGSATQWFKQQDCVDDLLYTEIRLFTLAESNVAFLNLEHI